MANPFAPLSTALQSDWTASEHQNAANFYYYEMQGATEELAGPNYKPLWSGMKAAFEDHTRKARALRSIK